jgi:hypothetical protein
VWEVASRFNSIAAALAGGMMLAACDPCAGVVACEGSPASVLSGRIVRTEIGTPVEGATIQVLFDRMGTTETLSTVTDAGGHWRLEIDPAGQQSVIVSVLVSSPGRGTYRVDGIEVPAQTRRGEATVLDSWVDQPYFPYVGEIYVRGTNDVRLSTHLSFRRTSGPSLSGPRVTGDLYSASSDGAGRFLLFGQGVYADGNELVSGELTIQLPGTLGATVHHLSLRPSHVFRDPTGVIRLGAGPSLAYVGEFHDISTGAPVAGIAVDFVRTGGTAIAPTSFSAVTDANGRFFFPLRAFGWGDVVGDLNVRPPQPFRSYVIRGLRLSPFDDDQARLLGVWVVGPEYDGPGVMTADR